MTTRAEQARALADRVEAGETGRDIDAEVLRASGCTLVMRWSDTGRELLRYPDGADVVNARVTTSLDAVEALRAAKLPGWNLEMHASDRMARVCLYERGSRRSVVGDGKTIAQGYLAALLRAMAQMEPEPASAIETRGRGPLGLD